MRRKGSITVFLALVLVLLFSMVLTTLEAARVAGGRAYVQMLSYMAGDSARALYYYPLFKQYGLLGVLAEDDTGYFSEDKIEASVKEDLVYMLTGAKGGLFSFSEPIVELTETKTLLSDNAEVFLEQIKTQAVLEGTEDVLVRLFLKQEFSDAAYATQLYQKQEEVLGQAATVTQEILRLMELVDGVITDEDGLCFDEDGRLKTANVFIKRICSLTPEELRENYKNEEVYGAIRDSFFSPKVHAEELLDLVEAGVMAQAEIAVCDLELHNYKERREEIAQELLSGVPEERAGVLFEEAKLLAERLEEAARQRDELIEWLDIAQMDMEEQYETLRTELNQVVPLLLQAEEILEDLKNKQLGAQLSVKAYEEYLEGLKKEISGDLYAVFQGELQRLKLYAGLSEDGYKVSEMRNTIEENRMLLEEIILPEFSGEDLYEISLHVQTVTERVAEYSVEGLWFTYGTITAVPSVRGNVFRMLEKIAAESVLALAGIAEKEISGKRLAGQSLPSAGLFVEELQTQIMACVNELSDLFQAEGILELLKKGAEYSLDTLALEWYAGNYFGCFGRELSGTRLSYEREYLLFGNRSDSGNLFFAVLYLVAVRSVFAMTSILKDAVKMNQLDAFAVSVAGFTGMPVLISAIKYGMMLLWSVEEAFVEVAVLLDGKQVPLLGDVGMIAFSELFLFGKEMVEKKASEWKELSTGLSYEEYLTILSLLQRVEKKAYRSLDLIQENIRSRYRDGFRIKNVVTGFSFEVKTLLEQKINTELWKEDGYEITIKEAVAF